MVEQIGFGETQLDRLRIARIVDRRRKLLPQPTEIALADRRLDKETFDRRETGRKRQFAGRLFLDVGFQHDAVGRSEEHTSELQSLMRISYAVFCLKQKKTDIT